MQPIIKTISHKLGCFDGKAKPHTLFVWIVFIVPSRNIHAKRSTWGIITFFSIPINISSNFGGTNSSWNTNYITLANITFHVICPLSSIEISKRTL